MSPKFHPTILEFLEIRKTSKLKSDLKDSMTTDEIESIHQKYNEIFEPHTWISKAAPRAGQISISTHPSKFSHPDAAKSKLGDTTSVIATSHKQIDGYLRTGNTESAMDAIGNAAALDVHQFLYLSIDGKTIIKHLQEDSQLAKENFSNIPDHTYAELKSSFLKMVDSSNQSITNEKIKQVYFPISKNPSKDEDYHLLSLIRNSGLIFEMRQRLDKMHFSDKTKELRDLRRSNKYSDQSYSEVFNSVTLAYGGTKPQNISVINSQNGGRAYLLASYPPEIKERDIKFPSKDFFTQCILNKSLNFLMKDLDRYYKDSRNNMDVRASYSDIIDDLIENLVITKMWQVREVAEEQYYEPNSQLSPHQKTWLLGSVEERFENDDWLDELILEISNWILSSYRKIVGEEKFTRLGEEEHLDLITKIQEHKEKLR